MWCKFDKFVLKKGFFFAVSFKPRFILSNFGGKSKQEGIKNEWALQLLVHGNNAS